MKFSKALSTFFSSYLALTLVFTPVASAADGTQTSTDNSDLINEVMELLENYNLSGIDKDTLIRGAIDGMVSTLNDPYSQYFNTEEAAQFEHNVDLEYVGIGIKLHYTSTEVYIEEITPGSPAEKAGLKRGDILLKINGLAIEDTVGDELSGVAGTQVTLLVLRNGGTKTYRVTRSEINTPSVTGKIIGQKIAYIALNGFTKTSDEEFTAVLKNMRSAGMKSLVLDLRDNLGGYMDTANHIASNFMDKGIIMYTSDQSGTLTPVTITNGSKIGVPVVVLTNEYSASASEALTGALRDNKIATVVGMRSYGKARIQSLIPISNGDQLKLTTQKYITPNKEDFNYMGLSPDITVKGKTAQLITALQIAGMTNIEASGDNHILNINGIAFTGNVGLLKNEDKIYASSLVLGALTESDVTWDAKNKKVLVTNGAGKVAGFTLSSKEAISKDGETYLELSAFKKKFPAFVWSYNPAQKQLKLSVK